MERHFAVLGSGFALLGVALGAFGAHALAARLEPRDLEIFETGVRYQMYHALALLFVAVVLTRGSGVAAGPWATWAGWAFVAGITIFSGSLYVLVLTGIRGLGAVTPVGGLALLAGWTLLVVHLMRAP